MGGGGDFLKSAVDLVTLDAFDVDGSKKIEKRARRKIEEAEQREKQKQKQEKEKQKKNKMQFYESLRQGNLGLLQEKEKQTIG